MSASVAADSLLQVIAQRDSLLATAVLHSDSIYATTADARHALAEILATTRNLRPNKLATWLSALTALAAIVGGFMAQWFNAFLNDSRQRERVRRTLIGSLIPLRLQIDEFWRLAHLWQLPPARHYWRFLESQAAAYDDVRSDVALLPPTLARKVILFFARVKGYHLGAEAMAFEFNDALKQLGREKAVVMHEKDLEDFESAAKTLAEHADELFPNLHAAVPRTALIRWLVGLRRIDLEIELQQWRETLKTCRWGSPQEKGNREAPYETPSA